MRSAKLPEFGVRVKSRQKCSQHMSPSASIRNGYQPTTLGLNPGEKMATGIEEYLAERGVTMSILEAMDEGLRRTRQVSLVSFGFVVDSSQTTLHCFKQDNAKTA